MNNKYIIPTAALFIGFIIGYVVFHKKPVELPDERLIETWEETIVDDFERTVQNDSVIDLKAEKEIEYRDSIIYKIRYKVREDIKKPIDSSRYIYNIQKINEWGENRY